MKSVSHIHFVIDGFELGSPAQQILDRFLIGYTRDGVFQNPTWRRMTVQCKAPNDLLKRRVERDGLQLSDDVSDADAIIAVNADRLLETHQSARKLSALFAYGVLSRARKEFGEIVELATSRKVNVLAGVETGTALRLPRLMLNGHAEEALVVAQGSGTAAELLALDGVLSFFERPPKIRRARYVEGADVWKAGEAREWSWALLRAALSRTDSPQGNALIDGRTEDIAGLGLAQKYATNPRAWLLDHESGMRTALLFLDGVVGDMLAAFKSGGGIRSTQLFRAPAPMHAEFDRLVAVIDDFFATGKKPWSLERAWIETAVMEHFGKTESRNGAWQGLGG
jgi:hypothetical protein